MYSRRMSWLLVGIGTAILATGLPIGLSTRAETISSSNWQGNWSCNLDGRSAVLILATNGGRVAGRINDNNRGWVTLVQRNLDSNDPSSSRLDHLLPLLYNNTDHWMLMMHTWNSNYASGYTTWKGIPFGLQCRRSN